MVVANRFGLSELIKARRGLPTEARAARTIATYSVIPATIVGLLAGTQLVGESEPGERLLLVCCATAFGAGIGVACLVVGVYRLFGFRQVAVLADALVGGFGGLLCESILGRLFDSWWPWLLVPLGALTAPLLLPREAQSGDKGAMRQAPRKERDAEPVAASDPAG